MTAKTNNTDNSATSDTPELTDDQLNAVSGGIIFVGGKPPVDPTTQSSGSGGGGGSGKVALPTARET